VVGTQPRVECSDLCIAETARLQFCDTFWCGFWCGPVEVTVVVCVGISGLVVEYIVAIDVTRVRFPADAFVVSWQGMSSQGLVLF
jgi:hypothetical protein